MGNHLAFHLPSQKACMQHGCAKKKSWTPPDGPSPSSMPPCSWPLQDSEVRRSFQRTLEKQGLKFKLATKVRFGGAVGSARARLCMLAVTNGGWLAGGAGSGRSPARQRSMSKAALGIVCCAGCYVRP